MMSVPVVPGSWMAALRPGERLVTVLAGTMIIITATNGDDGQATGQVERDRAGFMAARSGPDYPPGDSELFAAIEHADGALPVSSTALPVRTGRFAYRGRARSGPRVHSNPAKNKEP